MPIGSRYFTANDCPARDHLIPRVAGFFLYKGTIQKFYCDRCHRELQVQNGDALYKPGVQIWNGQGYKVIEYPKTDPCDDVEMCYQCSKILLDAVTIAIENFRNPK